METTKIKVKGTKNNVINAVDRFVSIYSYEVELKPTKFWSWRKFRFLYKATLKKPSITDEEIKDVINKILDKCNNQINQTKEIIIMKKISANYVYRNDSLSNFDEKYRPSLEYMKEFIKRDLIDSIAQKVEEEGLFNFEDLSNEHVTEFRAELIVLRENELKNVVNLLHAIDKTQKSPECSYFIENLKQLLIPKNKQL